MRSCNAGHTEGVRDLDPAMSSLRRCADGTFVHTWRNVSTGIAVGGVGFTPDWRAHLSRMNLRLFRALSGAVTLALLATVVLGGTVNAANGRKVSFGSIGAHGLPR